MMVAKVKEQDEMMVAKVKEQDGTTLCSMLPCTVYAQCCLALSTLNDSETRDSAVKLVRLWLCLCGSFSSRSSSLQLSDLQQEWLPALLYYTL